MTPPLSPTALTRLEKRRAYLRRYNQEHKAQIQAYKQQYQQRNREEVLARHRLSYHRHKARAQAYQQGLRTHRAALQRQYTQRHAEQIRAKNQLRYQKNKGRILATNKAYRRTNTARIQEQRHAYRQVNAQRIREQRHTLPQTPQAKALAYARNQAYRARRKGAAISDFTLQQWILMQTLAHHRCAYCQKRYKGQLERDHVIPLSKGGNHTWDNIVPACRSCNASKNAGPIPSPVQPALPLVM